MLVSVVIATYNGEKFLRHQLDSVVGQTHRNLEIIISDDCSTDSTLQIILDYEKRDSRIKIIRNEKNLGYIKNFEKASRLAEGGYVAICDQDDIWDVRKIEILLENVNGFDLCFSDSELIDEHGHSLNKNLSDIKNLRVYPNCLPFLIGNCISGHASLIKREMLLRTMPFPTAFVYDWWLAFFISCAGRINYVNIALVKYRQHAQNSIAAVKVSGTKRKKESQVEKLNIIRTRMEVFSKTAGQLGVAEKDILRKINDSYQNFSLKNNFGRSAIFLHYRNELLAIKKRSPFRKWLFCLKMFFKII